MFASRKCTLQPSNCGGLGAHAFRNLRLGETSRLSRSQNLVQDRELGSIELFYSCFHPWMNAMSIASTHPPDMSIFFGFIDMTSKTASS